MANSTNTQQLGAADAAKSVSKAYDMSVKDGIVIGFMLGLWLYSIILMFRAWSKILNFSDDQVGRPEKAAVLWKWLIERLRKSKKEKPPGQHLHHEESGKDQEESEIIEGGNAGAMNQVDNEESSQTPQNFCDEVVVVHTTERETLMTSGQVSGLPATECDSVHISESDKDCCVSPPLSDPLTYPARHVNPEKYAAIRHQSSIRSAELDFRLKLERISIMETTEIMDDSIASSTFASPPPSLPPKDYF